VTIFTEILSGQQQECWHLQINARESLFDGIAAIVSIIRRRLRQPSQAEGLA
jgi:hypothetical protein